MEQRTKVLQGRSSQEGKNHGNDKLSSSRKEPSRYGLFCSAKGPFAAARSSSQKKHEQRQGEILVVVPVGPQEPHASCGERMDLAKFQVAALQHGSRGASTILLVLLREGELSSTQVEEASSLHYDLGAMGGRRSRRVLAMSTT